MNLAINLLTNRKNLRFRRNVNLPVFGQIHLIAASENAETGDDGLVIVNYKTWQTDTLAAFSVSCENGMDVAGEREFVTKGLYFWMVSEDKIAFFKII